jgi:hypothetical protein
MTEGQDFFNMHTQIGYTDMIERLEYYYYYLRNLNKNYFNKFIDFGLFTFIEPLTPITTHIDADFVKDSIDLSVEEAPVGIKYSELYKFEDLGRVATEQHIFGLLEPAFSKVAGDDTINVVILTDDHTLNHKHTTT